MTIMTAQQICQVSSETTRGANAVGAELTAPLEVTKAQITENLGEVTNEVTRATFSQLPVDVYGDSADVTIEGYVPLRAAGVGAPPGFLALLKASGHREISTRVYGPSTDQSMATCPSCTVVVLQRESSNLFRRFIATGVKGNIAFSWGLGGRLMYTFTGQGAYHEVPDAAEDYLDPYTLPTSYTGGGGSFLVDGMTLTQGGLSLGVTSLDFQTNWTVQEQRSVTGSSQLDDTDLTRAPSAHPGGSIAFDTMEVFNRVISVAKTAATFELIARAAKGAEAFKLTCPAAQWMPPSMTQGEKFSFGAQFRAATTGATAGDDEYTLEY